MPIASHKNEFAPAAAIDVRLMMSAVHDIARRDFGAFVRLAFKAVDSSTIYLPNWHIRAIAHVLEEVAHGRIKRLIITMPPRSMKSMTASVAFPAWVMGRDPTSKFICISYAQPLAVKLHNDFRAVLDSGMYRATFPEFRINPRKNTENELETTAKGSRLATSVGGQLTGRGADYIVIDDPLKADDASSEVSRTKLIEWYRNSLITRLNSPDQGAIILVMQRLHVDDLAGVLLDSDGWVLLNLPAIAEEDQRIQIGKQSWHQRRAGELLHPARLSQAVLDEMKRNLGSLAFSAQYQQSPTPPDGNIIKRSWFRSYDRDDLNPRHMTIVQSWDTASKDGPRNDFSVCTTWAKDGDKYYLLDLQRIRAAYPELLRTAIAAENKFNPDTLLIEDIGLGSALIADLDLQGISAVANMPKGDKQSRLERVSAAIERGDVLFPKLAPWRDDFEKELLAFPADRHDDQVDSMTQALIAMMDEERSGKGFYIGHYR